MCLTPLDMLLSANKQWGYIESLSGTRDLNLPLAYVNRHLCVVATGGNTKGYGAIRAQTISLTQVRLYAYTPEDGAYSHYLSLGYQLQWGANLHGWVIFPIPFSQFRRLVTNHQGIVFMDSKAVESHSLSGFTLDVRNNNDSSEDAQWIAIGC